jgi:hypothetical protein
VLTRPALSNRVLVTTLLYRFIACRCRSTLSLLFVMRRPWSGQNRQSLLSSSVRRHGVSLYRRLRPRGAHSLVHCRSPGQERLTTQMRMTLSERGGRVCSCPVLSRTSHRGNATRLRLPTRMRWKRSSFFFVLLFRHNTNLNEKNNCAWQPPLDFFGPPITKPMSNNSKSTSSWKQATAVYRVSFKFKEGSSAAARKPVKMTPFL